MEQVKLSMILEVEEKDLKSLQRLKNHIEELLDLESWKEIKGVYDVKINKVK